MDNEMLMVMTSSDAPDVKYRWCWYRQSAWLCVFTVVRIWWGNYDWVKWQHRQIQFYTLSTANQMAIRYQWKHFPCSFDSMKYFPIHHQHQQRIKLFASSKFIHFVWTKSLYHRLHRRIQIILIVKTVDIYRMENFNRYDEMRVNIEHLLQSEIWSNVTKIKIKIK